MEENLPNANLPIVCLPTELLWEITKFLNPVSELQLTKTCQALHRLLWRRFCRQQLSEAGRRPFLLAQACIVGSTETISVALEYHLLEINSLIERSPCAGLPEPELPWIGQRRRRFHDSNQRGAHLSAPLHFAVAHNTIDVVRMLLHHGAYVDVLDEVGRTPLHLATDERCIALLLDAGASPLPQKSEFPIIPLGHLLQGHSRDENSPKWSPTLAAFRLLLDATEKADPIWSINIDMKDQDDNFNCLSPLAMAIDHGPEFVRVALEHGADPNRLVRSNVRPTSIPRGNMALAGFSRKSRTTSLQHAAFRDVPDALDTMKILHRFGAYPNEIHEGKTALLFAVASGNLETVRWLIKVADMDPNWCAPKSEKEDQRYVSNPLTEAIKERDVEMVKLLVGFGADPRHPAAAAVLVTTLGLPFTTDWSCRRFFAHPSASKTSRDLQDKGSQIADFLVRCGANPYYSVARAAYYMPHASPSFRPRCSNETYSRDRSRVRQTRARHLYERQKEGQEELFANSGPGQRKIFRIEYNPVRDHEVLVINSDGMFHADKKQLLVVNQSMWSICLGDKEKGYSKRDFSLHRYYRTWTMLHEVLMYNSRSCVEQLFRHNIDPLCKMVHSSQMKNTPLGVLIQARNFGVVKEDGYGCRDSVGPWTEEEWQKVRFLLNRFGPSLTERFPTHLMALFLAHAVARLNRPEEQEERIREFARLTGGKSRWGRDGISDLQSLVRHPAYCHAFREPAAVYSEKSSSDSRYVGNRLLLARNMRQARKTIRSISRFRPRSQKRHRPQDSKDQTSYAPNPLWNYRTLGACPRFEPLVEDEYAAVFDMLFEKRRKTQPMSEDDYEGFPYLYEKRKRTGTRGKRHLPKKPSIQSGPTPSNRFSILDVDLDD